MVGKYHSMLFGIIENKKFDLTCAGTTLKLSNHENILGKTIENKPFFNGQINNVCKTVNKKIITLIRINPFLKQLKDKLSNFSFIISQISYRCFFQKKSYGWKSQVRTWMFPWHYECHFHDQRKYLLSPTHSYFPNKNSAFIEMWTIWYSILY